MLSRVLQEKTSCDIHITVKIRTGANGMFRTTVGWSILWRLWKIHFKGYRNPKDRSTAVASEWSVCFSASLRDRRGQSCCGICWGRWGFGPCPCVHVLNSLASTAIEFLHHAFLPMLNYTIFWESEGHSWTFWRTWNLRSYWILHQSGPVCWWEESSECPFKLSGLKSGSPFTGIWGVDVLPVHAVLVLREKH